MLKQIDRALEFGRARGLHATFDLQPQAEKLLEDAACGKIG